MSPPFEENERGFGFSQGADVTAWALAFENLTLNLNEADITWILT